MDHQRTGLLVPTGDAAALAEAMLLLGRDPDLRGRMGAAGREFVLERFTSSSFVELMQRTLERCLPASRKEAPAP
jgi:glycosyltransferase involved in cell wall biosynthesis